MGRPNQTGGAVLRYGKIEMYGGENETLADLMKHLTSLLDKNGYPESGEIIEVHEGDSDKAPVEVEAELIKEDITETVQEETKEEVPVEVAELSPWERLLKKNQNGLANQ